jgi:hypothetical protein
MISVEFTGRFRERVQKLGLDRAAVFAAMQTMATAWGTPHLHAGIGIRRLKRDWFETRTGLHVRPVFQVRKGCITFHFAGDHDEVQRFARTV